MNVPVSLPACWRTVLATPPRTPLSVYPARTGPLGSVKQGPVPGPACVHVPSQCSLQNGQLLLGETAAAAAERISAVDGSCEKGLVDYILGREHGRRGGGPGRPEAASGRGLIPPVVHRATRRAAPPDLYKDLFLNVICSLLTSEVELLNPN